jgi:tRNA pseudouridine38-40 synthase
MDSDPTRRIAFTVQYDGSGFYGWQLQRRHRSVQGELEAVLGTLFARPARVLGSGRTDRGVHALGQVAAVDAPTRWNAGALKRAMNALVTKELWVSAAAAVVDDFHPRYDAVERVYIYRVGLTEEARSPFHNRWCWAVGREIDLTLLDRATAAIPGDRSFAAFAKAGQEERGHRCIVHAAAWREWEGMGLEFTISANRFLHHMVRYLVGTLLAIAAGERPAGDIERLLAGDPEPETSPPAPPHGLYLAAVRYPDGAYPAQGEAPGFPLTRGNHGLKSPGVTSRNRRE